MFEKLMKIKIKDMGTFINHVNRTGGVLKKTMFVHVWGREGLEACPRGQKCFKSTYFARLNFDVTV